MQPVKGKRQSVAPGPVPVKKAEEAAGIGRAPFSPKSRSGTFVKTALPWGTKEEVAFRREVERLYRERTGTQEWKDKPEWARVGKEEMREWAVENLSRRPPEERDEWTFAFVRWYQSMVRRNRVHMAFGSFALCGAKGRLTPIKSDAETDVTCPVCKEIFGRAEPVSS